MISTATGGHAVGDVFLDELRFDTAVEVNEIRQAIAAEHAIGIDVIAQHAAGQDDAIPFRHP
jgi:hypothetical protein